FTLRDPALTAIGELVHDIDLKDSKYERDETAGLAHMIIGLCASEREDEARIARGGQLFDYFYDYFRRKRS
ncbi:MAG: chromate resistance protein ChrB domain-containing protein, partial [Stellaceae bacterium]